MGVCVTLAVVKSSRRGEGRSVGGGGGDDDEDVHILQAPHSPPWQISWRRISEKLQEGTNQGGWELPAHL